MKVIPLPEQQFNGFTHLIEIEHTDLTQASTATAQTIEAMTVKVGTLITACAARLITPFKDSADAANNTTAIQVGDGGDTDRFLTSTELNENGTEILAKGGTGTQHAYVAADTLDVLFEAPTTGKTLLALDTGKVHIYVRVSELPSS